MLTIKAPAKINWTLSVLDKRADGYHNIRSLMHCITLCDTLSFSPADTLELITGMELPPEQNLVFKAARSLQQFTGCTRGARIVLNKEIPWGAGLGGGSSDAASALRGLNTLWELRLSEEELKMVGGTLGSDVPFFFDGPLALAEGRGEVLTPLAIEIPYTLLLVKPSVSVATAWAYGALSARRSSFAGRRELTNKGNSYNNIQLIYEALKVGDRTRLKALIRNDFEDEVIGRYPVIGALKGQLLACGAGLALMSGSGSTVFGLFENREQAVAASHQFAPYFCRVVETLTS
ncbi:MAG: 4-(cytidine 5'-diphospho)-2-C-methyl-D-erythritol kinase [Nitrospirota bacterium]